ncbi:ATP-dependent caseinolytic protease/crotonase family protein [Prunus dulcis]|uniref:3-hydroxyisobutyryl-CoA hydrolase n=1 Tax=Prunus dulcis TaxID=3755 RepID=A0A4Y1QZP9_PRUDU|nr:ATP-dependent caseinolytic protease/crotonase family protein [Prunus dulcis]
MQRGLCSLPDHALNDDLDHQVLVEGKAWSRTAILNRPSALNALTTAMGARLQKLYKSWEDNPDIGFIVMKGSGKAFCAGGDVVYLYHMINKGGYLEWHYHGWWCWVSIPGTFRIATDKTVFATPETLIGFHPDAGASFYLSHLPGHLGEFVALTGERLNGLDMIASGLATHYLHSSRLPLIEEELGKIVTDDPSVIEASLDKYLNLSIQMRQVCFIGMEAGRTNDAWCTSTLKRLKEVSPLSLKVALRSIREGRFQTLDQCLVREYRMSLQGITKQVSNDFCEGVRARVVEKDFAPKWDPPSVEKVSSDMVDQYFSPLSEFEPDLELPTELREAFT